MVLDRGDLSVPSLLSLDCLLEFVLPLLQPCGHFLAGRHKFPFLLVVCGLFLLQLSSEVSDSLLEVINLLLVTNVPVVSVSR